MLNPFWDGSQWCNIRNLKNKIITREFNSKDLGFIFQAWTPYHQHMNHQCKHLGRNAQWR
jgi:hypothetical protein